MKKPPLLKSKLVTPNTPDRSIFTDRIKKMEIGKNRMTVLTAQAGFGKTTAVLLSLERVRSQVRWYRLDKEDFYLPVFYNHLIETLFQTDEAILKSCLHMLYSMSNLKEEYVLLNAHICQYLEELVINKPERLYLVLDDFHMVVKNKLIVETVKYFAVNFPVEVSIIVTSRVETGLLSGNLVLRKDMASYSEKDLLFTKSEIRELISNKYHMDYTDESLDLLYAYSEGWITGVYLICHSLKDLLNLQMEIGELENQKENIFSAYLKAFLDKLDDKKRDILLKLSVMDTFTAEELRDLFFMEDAQEFIDWLETGNLYIQKLMTEPVKYRFHSLFSRELEKMYMQSAGEDERRQFLKKLALYNKESDLQKSIRYLLNAKLDSEAIKWAEDLAEECFLSSDTERMFYIITEFEEVQIEKSPYLQLFMGMMIMNLRIEDSFNYLIKAMKGFKTNRDYSFLMNTFGLILVNAFQTNNFLQLREVSKSLPIIKILIKGGSARNKLIISSFISLIGEDDLSKASELKKLIDKMDIQEGLWEYAYLMIRGILYYRKGMLKESKENLRLLLTHPAGLSNDQWRIIGLVSCCNVPFLTGDIKLLETFTEEFFTLGEKYNSDYAMGYAYYVKAHREFIQKDSLAAIDSLEKSMEYYGNFGATALVKESEVIKCLWGKSEDYELQIQSLKDIEKYFLEENTGHGNSELCRAIIGVLEKRRGNWHEAIISLNAALKKSLNKGSLQSVCGSYLHLSDLYFKMGDTNKGREYLKKWSSIGKDNNFFFFREMDTSTLDSITYKSVELDINPDYARYMRDLYIGNKEVRSSKKKVYIEFFGDFQLKFEDFVIEEKDFKTRKVSGILKYILVNNGKNYISREKLMSIFWPESDQKAAGASFRVALYELRKLLSKFNLGFESDNPLLNETKEGFIIGDNIELNSDVFELEDNYYKWKNFDLSKEKKVNLLRKTCQLYKGNFLHNSPYDDWVLFLQSHYSSIALECIHSYGSICMDSNNFEEAETILLKGLEIDPLDEIGCNQLLKLYKSTDRLDRAKNFWRKYEKKFTEEMGFKPNLNIQI